MRTARGDFDLYLRGRGIDIGCGTDPLIVPHGTVERWDLPQGDAQTMAGVQNQSFDFAYSSHCLEHLRDVDETLLNWHRIVKPGGFVYFVVPDYQIYEKTQWPSVYNGDHKQSFSLHLPRAKVQRSNHWCIPTDVHEALERVGLRIRKLFFEDDGFDYNLPPEIDQTLSGAMAQICVISERLK